MTMKYKGSDASDVPERDDRKGFWAVIRDLFFSREFLRYFVSGVVATLVNVGVFTLLTRRLGLSQWYLSNFPAIVLSVLAAYFLNRVWVFRSKSSIRSEFLRFVGTRLAISLVCEYAVYPVFYYGLGVTQEVVHGLTIAKIIALFFVVVGNRLSGKWFVFK